MTRNGGDCVRPNEARNGDDCFRPNEAGLGRQVPYVFSHMESLEKKVI